MRQTRNLLYPLGYRGFESLSLRHLFWLLVLLCAPATAQQPTAKSFGLRLGQRYQALAASGERDGKPVPVIGLNLRGTEIRFTAFDRDGSVRHFRGNVEGSSMSGESEGEGAPLRWRARLR